MSNLFRLVQSAPLDSNQEPRRYELRALTIELGADVYTLRYHLSYLKPADTRKSATRQSDQEYRRLPARLVVCLLAKTSLAGAPDTTP